MFFNDFCGYKISRLGFGCMRFPKSFEETKACIDKAITNGVNYFDTAYVYNNSEETLKKCLEGYNRNRYYLTSKLPIDLVNNKEDVEKLFNTSCSRLSVDYIDFYLLHAVNKERVEKIKKLHIIDELVRLKSLGKIKRLGFSIHAKKDVLLDLLSLYNFDFVQIQLNYLDIIHEPGFEGYEILTKRNIPVVIMEPVKGGLLANIPSPINDPFTRYDKNLSNASYCFRWLLQFNNIKVILSGMSSLAQVEDNLNTFKEEIPYTKELDDAIKEVRSNINAIPRINCTNCRYCMPCPFGVNIPGNFQIYNRRTLGKYLNSTYLKELKYKEEESFLKCQKCGRCLTLCPQKLNIPEFLDSLKNDL